MASVCLRMFLGIAFGGFIGLERGSKQRAAGFRTYMLVCLGAVLTILLGQYEHHMLTTAWAYSAQAAGLKTDVARFGAQVISGIGFLGAGTIIVTGRQEVKGLTTAAGLWASACMGLAIGAGFYVGSIVTFIMILLVTTLLNRFNSFIMSTARSMNLYIAYAKADTMTDVLNLLKQNDVHITDMHLTKTKAEDGIFSSAVLSIEAKKKIHHTALIAELVALENVRHVEEL